MSGADPHATITILVPVELSISIKANEDTVKLAVQSLQECLSASEVRVVEGADLRWNWKTRPDRLSIPAVVRHWMEAAKVEVKKLKAADVIRQARAEEN